jgi:[acyl-carrier-protein] S-malonyltransferase
VRRLLADGYENFVEIGPGNTLASFIKKIDKSARVMSVSDVESIKRFLQEVSV